ncbi:MAG: sigma 54-interacting transcriptional regulator [Ardenticatenaceae bacterium]|nr:sigma 54-interacting transcriptional regulator [Ardenticatenaceae bacterium]
MGCVHNDSERATLPFLAINCRAIPHELMISELWVNRANTDGRPSKFEVLHGGTLHVRPDAEELG